MSQSFHGTPALLSPFAADLAQARPSTPPPTQSPLPRTPRPQRFLNPPKTPLHKLQTSFEGGDFTPAEADLAESNYEAGMRIERPDSACSTYSSSSSSSVDTQTTYTSAGGSCTSPESEETFFPDKSEKNPAVARPETGNEQKRKRRRPNRTPRIEWTEDMDAHLWRSYILYQQDPKITPFFVLPGQSPPLGVCCKVARAARRTWKSATLHPEWRTPVASTPRTKRVVTPVNIRSTISNRGDALRKTTPYTWPASESATRRRLRVLCKQNYGPSRNPYHNHQQQRGSSKDGSRGRSSTVTPSPMKAGLILPNNRDPFFTTRSMALSLTTSTAASMRPNGVLASLAAGQEVINSEIAANGEPLFGGIAERIQEGSGSSPSSSTAGLLGLGFPFEGSDRKTESVTSVESSQSSTPSLLPALELGSSNTPYGTWPRRLKRPELQDDDDATDTIPPPKSRPRRGTLCDLFGESHPLLPMTVPIKTRARTRGYTISSGTNPLANKRRARPSAPLLTVTGPVSYDSPNGESPLASRLSDLPGLPPRLGSPFMERLDRKSSDREDTEASNSESERSPCGKRARE